MLLNYIHRKGVFAIILKSKAREAFIYCLDTRGIFFKESNNSRLIDEFKGELDVIDEQRKYDVTLPAKTRTNEKSNIINN